MNDELKGVMMITVLLLVMLATGVVAAADVTTFPVPDAAPDSPYTVVVDGVAVPVEKCGVVLPVYYARVVVSGAHPTYCGCLPIVQG